MATLIQDDLKQLGMHVQVVPLEFRSLIDRVTQTKEYDACLLGLVSFDADPNPDLNVWLSSGGTHLWNPSQSHPATTWEAEIDRLMEQQLVTPGYDQRKKLYDRVQEILAENQPMIFLASPDILVGAKNSIANFHPAILEPYAPVERRATLFPQRRGECRQMTPIITKTKVAKKAPPRLER